MKQIIAITGIILLSLGINSCKNEDWSFPDFDYTTTYFPYQFPVRTLVMGDYYFDNSMDKELKFLISVNSGGVYKNTENISVDFVVDPTLTDSLYNSSGGAKMYALPTGYYTLSNTSKITIPSGQPYGSVEVQLTQSFLDDPLAIGVNYVIPLRITASTTDSVLEGSRLSPTPDLRIPGDWVIRPKNYTLFGIKFVNEYHGTYLLRGRSVVTNTADGTPIDTVTYRNKYVEKNPIVSVSTASKDAVLYENSIQMPPTSPGKFQMNMTFDASGNAVLTKTSEYATLVSGTGKFSKNTEKWGGKDRHAIYLDYQLVESTRTHLVKDTLVFRDKGIKFEEFTPSIKTP